MLRTFVIAVLPIFGVGAQPLPNRPDSFQFAVIGDSGTGGRGQYDIGKLLGRYHETSPFTTVLMLGDNIYGREIGRASCRERV